jgi:hypothetical protein
MNGELDQNDTAPNDAGHDARVAYYTAAQREKKE